MKTPNYKKYMKVREPGKGHSLYSASSMDRIDGCPGNINLIKAEIEKGTYAPKDNKWSTRGVHTHTLIEFIWNEGARWLDHPSSKDFKSFLSFDSAMMVNANDAIAQIRKAMGKLNQPTVYIEEKLPLQNTVKEDCGGTSDVVMFDEDTLHIMDYKNGTGLVEIEENKQIMTYMLGALEKFGWHFKNVKMSVIQPNAPHKMGTTRHWTTTIKRMRRYKDELIMAIKKSKDPNAVLVPDSKWCFFCPVKLACPELQRKALVKLSDRFQKPHQFVKFTEPHLLEPLQIANLLNAQEYINIFETELREYAKRFLKKGGKIPGWTLTPKGNLLPKQQTGGKENNVKKESGAKKVAPKKINYKEDGLEAWEREEWEPYTG